MYFRELMVLLNLRTIKEIPENKVSITTLEKSIFHNLYKHVTRAHKGEGGKERVTLSSYCQEHMMASFSLQREKYTLCFHYGQNRKLHALPSQ